jgi:hypothetical protein
MLIYILIYINTNSFKNTYEKFVDEVPTPTGETPPTSQGIQNAIQGSITSGTLGDPAQIPVETPINDGRSIEYALLDNYFLTSTNRAKARIGGTTVYGNGYYWIDLPVIGKKLHFIITDTNVEGGNWILAMRGVINSTRFNYNSQYWTTASTYNDNSLTALNLDKNSSSGTGSTVNYNTISDSNKLKRYNTDLSSMFNISSIGDKIYSQSLSSDAYDAKFSVYNYYNYTEYMIVLYKTSQTSIARNTIITGRDVGDVRSRVPLLQKIMKTKLPSRVRGTVSGFNLPVGTSVEPKVRIGKVNTNAFETSGVGLGVDFYNTNRAGQIYSAGIITIGSGADLNYNNHAFELYVK